MLSRLHKEGGRDGRGELEVREGVGEEGAPSRGRPVGPMQQLEENLAAGEFEVTPAGEEAVAAAARSRGKRPRPLKRRRRRRRP